MQILLPRQEVHQREPDLICALYKNSEHMRILERPVVLPQARVHGATALLSYTARRGKTGTNAGPALEGNMTMDAADLKD